MCVQVGLKIIYTNYQLLKQYFIALSKNYILIKKCESRTQNTQFFTLHNINNISDRYLKITYEHMSQSSMLKNIDNGRLFKITNYFKYIQKFSPIHTFYHSSCPAPYPFVKMLLCLISLTLNHLFVSILICIV